MKDFSRRSSGGFEKPKHSLFTKLRLDGYLLTIVFALIVISYLGLYSAGEGDLFYVKRQLLFTVVGLVVMMITAHTSLHFIQQWAWAFYVFSIVALVVVLVSGTDVKGAQRWIDLGFMRFQPSEVMKLAVPIFVASYLNNRIMPPIFRDVLMAIFLALLPVSLVLLQPDLGTSIILVAAAAIVLILAGIEKKYIFSAIASVPVLISVSWIWLLRDYQKQRIITMFNPEADALGTGWNTIQATTAIGSGGFSGKGWLQGSQSRLDFLPEAHTDFIVAVLAEDFGFRGFLLLMFLYVMFFLRGFWISFHAVTSFSRLLAGSVTFIVFVYVFVNLGMVSGILPIVGAPLPFVSYGGSSLVTMFCAVGLLMSIGTKEGRLHAI